jgi:tetratricopeptide (TPR) repeat protein
MSGLRILVPAAVVAGAALFLLRGADSARVSEDEIWRHRNLGKAFYENPTTQSQAVDEFKKALDLAPNSARERVNYGLALLRAARTKEGIAELEKAQKQDPKIPHAWFNLGIAYKKDSDYDKAIAQFEGMVRLEPDEPKSHYNLAVLYKLNGKGPEALKEFEISSRLDPNLGGPHFQLYNAYRTAGRADDAARELKAFQAIKERTKGAAIPEDMEWSFYAEIYETIEPKPADQPAAELKFRDVAAGAKLDPKGAGMLALDFDGDGKPDALAWSAGGIVVLKNGTHPVSGSGLEGLKGVISVAAGDFNNDGLPDLCVITESGAALYVNKQGKFEKDPAPLPAGRFEKAIWIDYDHDYDLDLALLGENSKLLRNNGPAGFSDQTSDFPFVKGHALSGTPFSLVADTSGVDLVVSYEDRTGVLYRDKLAGRYEAIPLDGLPEGVESVLAYDIDNDGWMDLAVSGARGTTLLYNQGGKLTASTTIERAKAPAGFADLENRGASDLIAGSVIYRNQGAGRLPQAKSPLPAAQALAAADFDGDGRTDLAEIALDGSLHLLANQTETRNGWLRVGLTGVKNLKLATMSTVEVKAGALYQKRLYQDVPLTFGLGGYKEADTVRITWPNGLIQNEPKQPVGKAAAYKEAQRLSGSCPMIFTWNGQGFEFITDVLGVAPLGASSGDGKYFPVDHDEYVQIPGHSLAVADGHYEVRITEELREVSYLDHVGLIAVDHPAKTDIFTNDKFKSPPFPEFRLFGANRRLYPAAARDDRGDVLSRLVRRDRVYPDSFRRDFSGVAELHHLDLDFGKAAADNKAALILNGWVDWADGSTFLNASQQSKDGLVFPYLQVKDSAGRWQTVIADMGIPAGKPKTIAVDLTGKFLSASREVRIVTSLCIYWDEIFLIDDASAPPVRLTPMDADSASLRFRGFSRVSIHPERKQPESFDYARVSPASMWNPTPGLYTRYGDVRPLIAAIDDRLTIMGSGDELRLLFPVSKLPALPADWKRDFLLLVDGWAKDGDANTAYSQSVEPLPFHGMSQYPYASRERFPQSEAQSEYTTRPALRLLRPLASRGSEQR